MKTTDFAIQRVFSLIKDSEITLPVYKLTKPDKKSHLQYIVINALPISEGVLQRCYVNVNLHVRNLTSGMPDLKKLEEGTTVLMALLEDVPATGIIINFEQQAYLREDSLNEHYSNIRLSVKIVN